jgi:pyruvate kinase
MNLPGASLSARSPTEADLEYLRQGVSKGVDYAALSFVRSAEDLKRTRRELDGKSSDPVRLVAKIERPEAVEDLDNILDAADAIMIARGDLGVELPPEAVPGLQREVIRRSNLADRPVITATQMLESMTEHSRPTRAEVSDVAHAIWDGTDAVMLSAETASGLHPVIACTVMARVACEAELRPPEGGSAYQPQRATVHTGVEDVIGMAAALLAERIGAAAVAAITFSGDTARFASMARPPCPILGLSADERARRRMSLFRGVIPIAIPRIEDPAALAAEAARRARRTGVATEGDFIVLIYGEPLGSGVKANTLRLAKAGAEETGTGE